LTSADQSKKKDKGLDMEGRFVFGDASGCNPRVVVCTPSQIRLSRYLRKGFLISDLEQSEDDRDERIHEIDRRLSELDELLAKYIDSTLSYEMNNPHALSESELQFWTDRRQEREMLLALRDRLTKKAH
jgi:hypothetical protein